MRWCTLVFLIQHSCFGIVAFIIAIIRIEQQLQRTQAIKWSRQDVECRIIGAHSVNFENFHIGLSHPQKAVDSIYGHVLKGERADLYVTSDSIHPCIWECLRHSHEDTIAPKGVQRGKR
ncbi:hypothetical protein C8Q74DRAFT_1262179 [Fomes fomentarius]|nr:hypothetical protein C8Q74DRAFT_1262179 [Fomes fomentarius]